MKFVRLDDSQPQRSAEVLEALDFFSSLHALRKEVLSHGLSGRNITASVNLIKLKIAQMVQEPKMAAKTELLLANIADELSFIKRKNPEPELQKKAIGDWLFDEKRGYWKFLWEALFNEYVPKLTRSLQKGFGNVPPVDEETANDIAIRSLGEFMEQKDKASVVNSLSKFDASQGSLLSWLEGGVKVTTQGMVKKHFNIQNKEISMNKKIGDNDDTEMGDMLSSNDGDDPFDLVSYSDKADRLLTSLSNFIRNVNQRMQQTEAGPEKFKLQTLLENIKNPEHNVNKNIQMLKELGDKIDYFDVKIRDLKIDIKKYLQSIVQRNRDQNIVEVARQQVQEMKEEIAKYESEKNQAIEQFKSLHGQLEELKRYDENTGQSLVEDSSKQQPVGTPKSDEVPVDNATEVLQPQIRTKARGNRVLLSPADAAMIEEKMLRNRNKIRPAMFKSLSFPLAAKNMRGLTNNLFNLREVSKNIESPEDLNALIQGDLSKASVKAIYADIVVRGMLYARDQAAIDKAYDPEVIVSGSEEMRRALNKFYNFVQNEVENNEILNTKEAEFHTLPPEEQKKIANGMSPKAFVLFNLSELISDPNASQAGTEVNRFRTLYEYFDHMARAASYEANRAEKFKDKDWDELSDDERREISKQVYEEQYGAGHRPMYIGRHREKSQEKKKFEPRYPMAPDTEGEKYQDVMNRELWRIGRQRALSKQNPNHPYSDEAYQQYRDPAWNTDDWYEISSNPEDFKNKNKPRGESLAESGLVDVLIKIAGRLDILGAFKQADLVTSNIRRLAHG